LVEKDVKKNAFGLHHVAANDSLLIAGVAANDTTVVMPGLDFVSKSKLKA